MPRWRYRVHRWETTAEAVYAASGWLLQEWRVAPLSRVQTVDTQRGPLQQLFGLASVTVTTASSRGAIVIDGLDHDEAVELVSRLTETTQAIPGDATWGDDPRRRRLRHRRRRARRPTPPRQPTARRSTPPAPRGWRQLDVARAGGARGAW